jgi:hypothetical protein
MYVHNYNLNTSSMSNIVWKKKTRNEKIDSWNEGLEHVINYNDFRGSSKKMYELEMSTLTIF